LQLRPGLGDLLDEWFETDALKGTKAASGIIGTFLGPRSPGTAYVLLHHYMGEIDGAFRAWGFAKGGSGGVSGAIANSARHGRGDPRQCWLTGIVKADALWAWCWKAGTAPVVLSA
jgi:phytoene dehydrogenase-like protein